MISSEKNNMGSPRTNKTFAILDPTTLPKAIPESPDKDACIATISSGADVPNATTVKPIIKGEILNLKPAKTLPLTKESPQKLKRKTPAKI